MKAPLCHITNNQHLWMSGNRCLYWEEQKALVLSDLHFGKTGHFRKAGIHVPQTVFKTDLQRLFQEIQFFKPSEVIIVGDLFHSRENLEMDWFLRWREDLGALPFALIKGNHDILTRTWYEKAGIDLHHFVYSRECFSFLHDVRDMEKQEAAGEEKPCYLITGHVHPGVRISGAGKQSLSFPCFYFGRDYAVLPAFSHFTGLYTMRAETKRDRIYAIVDGQVMQVKG